MRKIQFFAPCSGSHALALVALFSFVYLMYRTGPGYNNNGHNHHRHQVKQGVNQLIVERATRGMGVNYSHDQEEDEKKKTKTAVQAYWQNISRCLCSRRFMYKPPPDNYNHNKDVSSKIKIAVGRDNFPRLNSSCSDEGTHYQSGQNVISMSLWLSRNATSKQTRNYQIGIFRNLEMMRKHYPGHSLRLYTNLPLNHGGYYCDILCKNEDLFWCDIRNVPTHGDLSGMIFRSWRFLTLGDPTVSIFHCRDLDSLIRYREADAVKDWLSKENHKAIMLMRDRKVDHDVPILAGMWGADNTKLGSSIGGELRTQIIRMSKIRRIGKSWDQNILEKVVFYPLRGGNGSRDIVAYDAYTCVNWSKFTEVRPFPTQKRDPARDFVASQVDFVGGAGYRSLVKEECPVECRPDYGKHWVYC